MDYIKIGDLIFQRNPAVENMRLESCNIYKEKALDSTSLAFDTMSAKLYTTTAGKELEAVPINTPIIVYRGDEVYATFLMVSASRTGPYTYTVEAQSPLGRLSTMSHPGGIYTGQRVEDVVRDICGSIPVLVETMYADIRLFGWLPYTNPPQSSARDNLVQVLFAIGAYLSTDLNGVLRVEKLWNGIASTIDLSYSGGRVKYGAAVSAVMVLEHQYIVGEEEQKLFEGVAADGYIVTFDDPMHSLSATGFRILDHGANYAKLSAGSGVLTGKKYIHNTRQIIKSVTKNAAENVKSITNATLVSQMNSIAVAQRLADYYQNTTTISTGIVTTMEKPGYVVRVYDPYEKMMVNACIQSLDTTLSNTLKATMEAMVGYIPPNDIGDYYDAVDIITSDTTWTSPVDGEITVVVVGGGDGGQGGGAGKDNNGGNNYYIESGGVAGLPGPGGKIYRAVLNVTLGQQFDIHVGPGGTGGDPGMANGEEGSLGTEGGATTFGSLSSANGSSLENGWVDPTTLRGFGVPGKPGINGAHGGKSATKGDDVEFGGKTYAGGDPGKSNGGTGGGGGGAAVGSPGFKGHDGSVDKDGTKNGGQGGDGGPATIPGADGTDYGCSGSGGHGGGGGGQGGTARFSYGGGNGAAGSRGGDGKPGVVLLYYRKPKQTVSGWGVTSKRQWRLDKYGRRCIV